MTDQRSGWPSTPDHIPPLRFRWLTPYYDRVVAWTVRDAAIKARVAALLDDPTGARVLDLGCGTGTLSLVLASEHPNWRVTGVDADTDALALARAKGASQSASIEFKRGYAESLPFPDASFEAAASCLMFHHLLPDAKRVALSELRRVLIPGGQLLIADFGRAEARWRRCTFRAVRLLDGAENTRDHAEGRFPDYLAAAGFQNLRCVESWPVPVGSVDLLCARSPD